MRTSKALLRWSLECQPTAQASPIGTATDSRGRPITATMWRANRLVDLLAKSAAIPHRLPQWATRKVADAGKLFTHHAARLGLATHLANNHTISVMVDGGNMVRGVIRDSTAERPAWRLRHRMRPAARPAIAIASVLAERNAPTAGVNSAMQGRKRMAPKPSAAAVAAKKRDRVETTERLKSEAAEELQLSRWLATRVLPAANGIPVSERFAALRERVRR